MTAHTDGDDPRLADLLLRWEELHEQGQSLSAEELCSTCPELAEELGRRIALLRAARPAPGRHHDRGRRAVRLRRDRTLRAASRPRRGPSSATSASTPPARSARSSWPATPSSTARWR